MYDKFREFTFIFLPHHGCLTFRFLINLLLSPFPSMVIGDGR